MKNKSFWGITSYFNPSGYRSRFENYQLFRKHLKIPLVTVELSFNGKFELASSDADILVQIKGRDIMWQKERLLNIAMQYLPEICDKVIWLDCDLIFTRQDWFDEASELLNKYKLIQPFKRLYHLPPISTLSEVTIEQIQDTQPFLTEYSFAYCSVNNFTPKKLNGRINNHIFSGNALGVTWAAHKKFVLKQKIYDSCIAGGGDTAMALAACGKMEELQKFRHMSQMQIQHYLKWAESFYAKVKNDISFLDCDICHLWHGHFNDRNYQERHKSLMQSNFDPYNDISIDKNGCWQWSQDKPELRNYLSNYFSLRNEDTKR